MPTRPRRSYRRKTTRKPSKDKRQDRRINKIVKVLGFTEPKMFVDVQAQQVAAANVLERWSWANGIAAGVSDGQRVGDQVKLIRIDMSLTLRNISADTPHTVRWFIMSTTDFNAQFPVTAEVVSPQTPYGWPKIDSGVKYTHPKNNLIKQTGEVTIWKDSGVIYLDPVVAANTATGGVAGTYQKTINFSKIINHPVKYKGVLGSDVGTGDLCWAVIGSSTDIGFSFAQRTIFIDV